MLYQLSYTHHQIGQNAYRPAKLLRRMARQKGLEPLTHGLEGRCSVRLSYWRKNRGEPI